jgi:hypothetical protein
LFSIERLYSRLGARFHAVGYGSDAKAAAVLLISVPHRFESFLLVQINTTLLGGFFRV